jgi:predicted adenylyl cyclase CyaB
MPSNIEIKAILNNREAVEAIAAQISDVEPELIRQEDHFFHCDAARLKLRILAPDRGELIRYERVDLAEARRSCYQIARTTDPLTLLEILSNTLGSAGIVRKERTLYLIGQTRLHLDRVSGLGDFMELEVVLRPDQSDEEGKAIAEALLLALKIEKQQLIEKAYIDLLRDAAQSAGSSERTK